jgi:hypothetical protein
MLLNSQTTPSQRWPRDRQESEHSQNGRSTVNALYLALALAKCVSLTRLLQRSVPSTPPRLCGRANGLLSICPCVRKPVIGPTVSSSEGAAFRLQPGDGWRRSQRRNGFQNVNRLQRYRPPGLVR